MLGEHLNPTNDPLPMAPIPDATGPANFFVGTPGDDPATASTDKRGEQAERIVTNLLVRIRPSSCSQRFSENITGYCKNVSESGCGVTSDFAPRVGDIYQFEIDDPGHILHGIHARCVRCHLLDETAFDCGFSFLSPLAQGRSSSSTASPQPLV